MAVLGALHDGLKRLRLMHRRGRRLLTTKRGRALSADPEGLGLRRPACRRSRGLRPAGRRTARALTTLHDAIQEAFGWWDDHLYAFWADGRFWGEQEYTSPVMAEPGTATADITIAALELPIGATLAYVFDFGDEWRVRLKLVARETADGGAYPRVVRRTGTAPPQYREVG